MPNWSTCGCEEEGVPCIGERVPGFDRCLAHLGDGELPRALEAVGPGASINARGTSFGPELLERVLNAVGLPGRPVFGAANFDYAHFDVATPFRPDIWFAGDTVVRPAWLSLARFGGHVSFEGARFEGDAWFTGAEFEEDVNLRGARFAGVEQLGPFTASGRVLLDWATFAGSVVLEVSAPTLSCKRVTFENDVILHAHRAAVDLSEARFLGFATVAGTTEPFQPLVPASGRKATVVPKPDRRAPHEVGDDPPPRVASLRGVDAGHLTLTGVDLSACRFAGTRRLDQLRVEDGCRFAGTPRGLQRGLRWPPIWWWTRRQTLAEEHAWRARRYNGVKGGWEAAVDRSGDVLAAGQLAVLYRQLRKATEDVKNEPGAADFYYGEMEMRRMRDSGGRRLASWPEHMVVWLYWLVSGYGLRASRALVALALTIAVSALLFDRFGFDPHQRPDAGPLLFAVESSIGLLRAPEPGTLTAGGHVVQIALRLAGPLFFGLAILSLRGRVKR